MKGLFWTAGVLAAIVLVIVLVGWMLPVAHVASGSVRLARPSEEIHAIVSDVASYPAWWADMTQIEMLPPVDGRTRFRQFMGADPVIVEVLESVPPTRFVTRIADPDQPFGGTWTLEIAPDGTGSRLTVIERGEVYNPVFRFVSRFVFGHTATIDSFLRALQRKAG
jgi:uncharacterized protein YndB with AHSA1/START domain